MTSSRKILLAFSVIAVCLGFTYMSLAGLTSLVNLPLNRPLTCILGIISVSAGATGCWFYAVHLNEEETIDENASQP